MHVVTTEMLIDSCLCRGLLGAWRCLVYLVKNKQTKTLVIATVSCTGFFGILATWH